MKKNAIIKKENTLFAQAEAQTAQAEAQTAQAEEILTEIRNRLIEYCTKNNIQSHFITDFVNRKIIYLLYLGRKDGIAPTFEMVGSNRICIKLDDVPVKCSVRDSRAIAFLLRSGVLGDFKVAKGRKPKKTEKNKYVTKESIIKMYGDSIIENCSDKDDFTIANVIDLKKLKIKNFFRLKDSKVYVESFPQILAECLRRKNRKIERRADSTPHVVYSFDKFSMAVALLLNKKGAKSLQNLESVQKLSNGRIVANFPEKTIFLN